MPLSFGAITGIVIGSIVGSILLLAAARHFFIIYLNHRRYAAIENLSLGYESPHMVESGRWSFSLAGSIDWGSMQVKGVRDVRYDEGGMVVLEEEQ
jgi:hypothetical protein